MKPNNPEAALATHYNLQAAEYERVLEFVKSAETDLQNGRADLVGEAGELILALQERDRSIAKVRDAWFSNGNRPGPELKQALTRVESLILESMEAVKRAEATAKVAKSRLLPRIDDAVNAQRGHSAYAKANSYADRT